MKCPHCHKPLPSRQLSQEQKEKAVIRTKLWRWKKAQRKKPVDSE